MCFVPAMQFWPLAPIATVRYVRCEPDHTTCRALVRFLYAAPAFTRRTHKLCRAKELWERLPAVLAPPNSLGYSTVSLIRGNNTGERGGQSWMQIARGDPVAGPGTFPAND